MSTKTTILPLEQTFNIEAGSTRALQNVLEEDDQMMAISQATANEVAPYQDDAEDKEIAEQIKTIYDAAMDAFDNQTQLVEVVEPRYAARLGEIANQSLNTALNAVALRSKNKNEKRKTAAFVPFANQSNQTNIVMASRNDLLKMIKDRKEVIIDAE
jgi:hypothetical protein